MAQPTQQFEQLQALISASSSSLVGLRLRARWVSGSVDCRYVSLTTAEQALKEIIVTTPKSILIALSAVSGIRLEIMFERISMAQITKRATNLTVTPVADSIANKKRKENLSTLSTSLNLIRTRNYSRL